MFFGVTGAPFTVLPFPGLTGFTLLGPFFTPPDVIPLFVLRLPPFPIAVLPGFTIVFTPPFPVLPFTPTVELFLFFTEFTCPGVPTKPPPVLPDWYPGLLVVLPVLVDPLCLEP